MTTRFGLYGGSRGRYGEFSGKTLFDPPREGYTRMGLYGGTRMRYGSFDGKTETSAANLALRHEGFRQNVGKML